MSMDYWAIEGYGVDLDEIEKYINTEKVNELVRKLLPNETFEEDVFEDDTFYGDPYTNFAEFLCELDEENIFCYEDDGNARAFFLYEPSYPWARNENEPKDKQEAEDKMIKVLKKVYDATWNDLRSYIRYISTYGCG